MNTISSLCLLMAITVMATLGSGCSIIGYGAGSLVDHSMSPRQNIEAYEIGKCSELDSVTVFLRDGSRIDGRYLGLSEIPKDNYAGSYQEALSREFEETTLPEIGDTIVLQGSSTATGEQIFLGFGYQFRNFHTLGPNPKQSYYHYLFSRPVSQEKFRNSYLSDINRMIVDDTTVISGKSLRALLSTGDIPLFTQANVASGARTYSVPLQNISMAHMPRKRNFKYVGLGIGLAFDVATIAVLIAAYSWSSSWDWSD